MTTKYKNNDNKINTIINNGSNATFFRNAKFHNDINYKIENDNFIVIAKRDFGSGDELVHVHYELEGSKIGNYIRTEYIK